MEFELYPEVSITEDRKYEVEAIGKDGNYTAIVVVTHFGHRCGYVGVPESHPAYNIHYNNLEHIDVHGGLTFSGGDAKYPIETNGKMWWLGFDYAHYGDNPNIQNTKYVMSECENLAEQLKIMEIKLLEE